MTANGPGSPARAIVIVGAGAHGAVVADILQRARGAGAGADVIGFVDDTPGAVGSTVLGLAVLGSVASLSAIPHDEVIVAVGDNRARREITERLRERGERLATAVHPRACVAPSVVLGAGSMVCAGAVIAPLVELGAGVIVNTQASVDHHSIVHDFAHVSAGATVGGRVVLGSEVLVAVGASIVSGLSIGDRTIVGAGAVVLSPMPADVVAFGVPARVRRSLPT
jgi:sugar O-acyltransferase (sialic acid O-acetyltransferase NeuD family)